jgi:hypothetical protein
VRFFPLKNADNSVVPDTYIVTMDYSGASINFDFNDNIYIISNIKPA